MSKFQMMVFWCSKVHQLRLCFLLIILELITVDTIVSKVKERGCFLHCPIRNSRSHDICKVAENAAHLDLLATRVPTFSCFPRQDFRMSVLSRLNTRFSPKQIRIPDLLLLQCVWLDTSANTSKWFPVFGSIRLRGWVLEVMVINWGSMTRQCSKRKQ